MRYALGVMEGKYPENAVFTGMLDAMCHAGERASQGKGLQNMSYTSALVEFAAICAATSPEVYRMFRQHIQLPTIRSQQYVPSSCHTISELISPLLPPRIQRSKMPRFPMTISDRTFDRACEYVESMRYKGPIALSVDDTKLHPVLKPYWDSERECHFLVGVTGEPIAVPDVDLIQEIIASAKKDAATKVSDQYVSYLPSGLLLLLDSSLVLADTPAESAASHSGGQSNSKQFGC